MRLNPKLVHPSIFRATDTVTWSNPTAAGSPALMKHQSEWFKEYGKGCAAYGVFAVVLFIGTVSFADNLVKPWRGIFVLSMLALMAGVGIWALVKNHRQMSVNELETLLPVLDLSDSQRAYGETVVALYRSGQSAENIEETMAALNQLLDEEARLQEYKVSLEGHVDGDLRKELDEERTELARKLEASQDPVAKETYRQSLAMLDERIVSVQSNGGHLERLDAHLGLLRQAVFATRDAARRLGGSASAPVPDLMTDSLRSAVALARAQVSATEKTLEELRTL